MLLKESNETRQNEKISPITTSTGDLYDDIIASLPSGPNPDSTNFVSEESLPFTNSNIYNSIQRIYHLFKTCERIDILVPLAPNCEVFCLDPWSFEPCMRQPGGYNCDSVREFVLESTTSSKFSSSIVPPVTNRPAVMNDFFQYSPALFLENIEARSQRASGHA